MVHFTKVNIGPETRTWTGPLGELVIRQNFDELGRDLSQYGYWGNPLKQIDQAFKCARPTGVWQWWVEMHDEVARFSLLIAVSSSVCLHFSA